METSTTTPPLMELEEKPSKRYRNKFNLLRLRRLDQRRLDRESAREEQLERKRYGYNHQPKNQRRNGKFFAKKDRYAALEPRNEVETVVEIDGRYRPKKFN